MTTETQLAGGRFRTIRRLGTGGMASVYLAEDVRLGRKVAIKRVHPEHSIDVAPRFRREMRLAASLSHPNLVRLLDAIVDEGAVLLIMEYVEGETLAERLGRGRLELPVVREVLRALADTVDYLHSQGVIHRDIKPANILLDRAGRVKLADLGIASAAEATGITTSGSVLGTPAYMAPELFEGKRAGPAADVYSLAAVTFEMLTGERAQPGTTVPEIALGFAREAPPDLREHWPEAGALAAALQRGMARRPNERPSAASLLLTEVEVGLREAQERRTVRPSTTGPRSLLAPTTPVPVRSRRPADRPRRPRRLAAPLLFAALILMAGAVAAIVLTGGDGTAEGPRAQGSAPQAGSAGQRTTSRSSSTGTAERRAPSRTTDTSAGGSATGATGSASAALQHAAAVQHAAGRRAAALQHAAARRAAAGCGRRRPGRADAGHAAGRGAGVLWARGRAPLRRGMGARGARAARSTPGL